MIQANQVSGERREKLDDLARSVGFRSWTDYITALDVRTEPLLEVVEIAKDSLRGIAEARECIQS